MHCRFGEIWPSGFWHMLADRQTNRQTDVQCRHAHRNSCREQNNKEIVNGALALAACVLPQFVPLQCTAKHTPVMKCKVLSAQSTLYVVTCFMLTLCYCFLKAGEWIDFYRYASAVFAVVVCPPVCPSQAGVISKRLDESSWFLAWRLPSTYPTLRFKEIRVSLEIRLLPSETLPQTLDLENFATASPWCISVVNKTRWRPTLWIAPTTVERVVAGCTKFITRWLTVTLLLHYFALFWTCRTSCSYTVMQQLARFRLTYRVMCALNIKRFSACPSIRSSVRNSIDI